jgi:cytochrome bd-type quinol oxidase subunit 1
VDFPLFHLDFFGNRMLIGVIAVLHVVINHSLAVGAAPLIAVMEWWGRRSGDQEWDRLAYRLLRVCFIITTSVGALTGVGIWLSSSLANPSAIGSLIRVFFWAWFTEWIVFAVEVSLILAYFLTWNGWGQTHKRLHISMGAGLAVFSWLTMAIIVAILGFMMEPGAWVQGPSFWRGILNPIYLPQLLFRTPLAMVTAGVFAMFLAYFFTERGGAFRNSAVRFVSGWTLVWLLPCLAGAWSYWAAVPETMIGNVPVALATQAFESWSDTIGAVLAGTVGALLLTAIWGLARPGWLPRAVLVVPFALAVGLLGTFERGREFVRKPYVIGNYMYANGIRPADYPLLQEQGVLTFASYVSARRVTDENRLQAGQDVFRITCSRCHTTRGVNSVVAKLERLYGRGPWDRETIRGYAKNMHNTRPFMPPFPGNEDELRALAEYLVWLQSNPVPLAGAQSGGVAVPDGEASWTR